VGTTEAELRRSAEADRARMGETLDAIGDRLSPERVIERKRAAVGQRVRRVRMAVMGSPSYQEPGVAGRVTGAAQNMASSASDAAQGAMERVQHAPEAAAEQVRGNPLAAGLIAFGVGALLATAFPKTETEQRLVASAQPQLDAAKSELRQAGQELGTEAKERAQSAAQELTSTVKDAASNVSDQASSSAQQVAETARQSSSS